MIDPRPAGQYPHLPRYMRRSALTIYSRILKGAYRNRLRQLAGRYNWDTRSQGETK